MMGMSKADILCESIVNTLDSVVDADSKESKQIIEWLYLLKDSLEPELLTKDQLKQLNAMHGLSTVELPLEIELGHGEHLISTLLEKKENPSWSGLLISANKTEVGKKYTNEDLGINDTDDIKNQLVDIRTTNPVSLMSLINRLVDARNALIDSQLFTGEWHEFNADIKQELESIINVYCGKAIDDNAVKAFIRVITENTNYELIEKHKFDELDKSTHPKKKGYYQTNHCVALYEEGFGFHAEHNNGYTDINQYVTHWCELPTISEGN